MTPYFMLIRIPYLCLFADVLFCFPFLSNNCNIVYFLITRSVYFVIHWLFKVPCNRSDISSPLPTITWCDPACDPACHPVCLCQDRIHEAEYGHDLQTCQTELDSHHKEHKVIDQFQVQTDIPGTRGTQPLTPCGPNTQQLSSVQFKFIRAPFFLEVSRQFAALRIYVCRITSLRLSVFFLEVSRQFAALRIMAMLTSVIV